MINGGEPLHLEPRAQITGVKSVNQSKLNILMGELIQENE